MEGLFRAACQSHFSSSLHSCCCVPRQLLAASWEYARHFCAHPCHISLTVLGMVVWRGLDLDPPLKDQSAHMFGESALVPSPCLHLLLHASPCTVATKRARLTGHAHLETQPYWQLAIGHGEGRAGVGEGRKAYALISAKALGGWP